MLDVKFWTVSPLKTDEPILDAEAIVKDKEVEWKKTNHFVETMLADTHPEFGEERRFDPANQSHWLMLPDLYHGTFFWATVENAS